MARWIPVRIVALCLGLWVALAPALFAVPAAAMAVQAGMCEEAVAGGCDACPDADRETCAFVCLSGVQFTAPFGDVELAAVSGLGYRPGKEPTLAGRLSMPDPAPPKSPSLL